MHFQNLDDTERHSLAIFLQILPHGIPAYVERFGGAGEVLTILLIHAVNIAFGSILIRSLSS